MEPFFTPMKSNLKGIDFLNWDRLLYEKFRKIRDKWNYPVVKKLDQLKITPLQISIFRLVFVMLGLWFIGNINWLWLLFYAIFLVLDAWDGALARFQQCSSTRGEIIDLAVDIGIKVLFVLKLIYVGYLSGFWGAFYLMGFLVNFFLGAILASKRKVKFPMFPSSDLMILAFLFFTVTGVSCFDVLAVFLSVFFAIKDLFLLDEFLKTI
jgi:phosphatidylglycerophosphate synthase